jgi:predicted nucleic acid-binding protein
MIVIADTTPINYLTLIGEIGLLRALYSEIVLPPGVLAELLDARAPKQVRDFAADLPAWVRVLPPVEQPVPRDIEVLGRGEREAILLALDMSRDIAPAVLLTDDREARHVAAMYSVATISTLRVLADASEVDAVSLEEAFIKLRATSFRVEEQTLQLFLSEDAIRRKTGIQ